MRPTSRKDGRVPSMKALIASDSRTGTRNGNICSRESSDVRLETKMTGIDQNNRSAPAVATALAQHMERHRQALQVGTTANRLSRLKKSRFALTSQHNPEEVSGVSGFLCHIQRRPSDRGRGRCSGHQQLFVGDAIVGVMEDLPGHPQGWQL